MRLARQGWNVFVALFFLYQLLQYWRIYVTVRGELEDEFHLSVEAVCRNAEKKYRYEQLGRLDCHGAATSADQWPVTVAFERWYQSRIWYQIATLSDTSTQIGALALAALSIYMFFKTWRTGDSQTPRSAPEIRYVERAPLPPTRPRRLRFEGEKSWFPQLRAPPTVDFSDD